MLISSSRTRRVASGAFDSPTQAASATSRARRSRVATEAFTAARPRRAATAARAAATRSTSGGVWVMPCRHLLARSQDGFRQSIGSGSENAPRDVHDRLSGRLAEQRPQIGEPSPLSPESGRQDGDAGQVRWLDAEIGDVALSRR